MSTNKIITKAIQLINPNAEISIDNHDIDTVQWHNGTTPIAKTDIEAKLAEAEQAIADEEQAEIDLKASAKAKLIAGEALTEDEANTIVL
nr:hypothetical protein [uncultured Mediterranean phage uvMED]